MTHTTTRFVLFALYIGPDVMLPVASAIAAVAGFLLMFWRRTVNFVKGIGQKIAGLFSKKT